MTHEEREEEINFIIEAVWLIEGYQMNIVDIAELYAKSDEDLQKEADWYDYLLGK